MKPILSLHSHAAAGGQERRRVVFALFPGCEIMDIAGPLQAFSEAAVFGSSYETVCAALTPTVLSAQGIAFAGLSELPAPRPGDRVIVPGYPIRDFRPPAKLLAWLRRSQDASAVVCAVCTGAFALGDAGLLNGRRCTTHWRRVPELKRRFPRADVIGERLFVRDGPIVTSAGIAAGIDMALAFLEEDCGPVVASHVAREMVLYMRRDGSHGQDSVYLDFQTHLHPGIHRVQQYLINNPASRSTLPQLGRMAGMSERHFSRTFKRATGISVQAFRDKLRMERAQRLLQNPEITVERVAAQCGFADARQLRRRWQARFGASPRRRQGTS